MSVKKYLILLAIQAILLTIVIHWHNTPRTYKLSCHDMAHKIGFNRATHTQGTDTITYHLTNNNTLVCSVESE